MRTIPTSTLVIKRTTAEYAAELLCDAVWDENGTYQAGVWSTARNHPATFRVVMVSADGEDLAAIHFVSLATGDVAVAFHTQSDDVNESVEYIRSVLSRLFTIACEDNPPAIVGDPTGPNRAQRRRLENIAKAHDLKSSHRDIARKEIAQSLGVSLRTIDTYLKTFCNRRNCAYCTKSAH